VLDKWVYFGMNKGFAHSPQYTAGGIQTTPLFETQKAKGREQWTRQKNTLIINYIHLSTKSVNKIKAAFNNDSVWRKRKENAVVKVLQF
jgi:hypothetical protein